MDIVITSKPSVIGDEHTWRELCGASAIFSDLNSELSIGSSKLQVPNFRDVGSIEREFVYAIQVTI